MSSRAVLLGILLMSVPMITQAIPRAAQEVTARADQYVEGLSSAAAFLREVRDTVELARAGEYGKIKPADLGRLDEARSRITELLEGHEHARQLSAEERIELFNAQELITSIVRNDDKSRRVCTKVHGTGTRIARSECLTVAQREQRAQETREATRVQQGFREPSCSVREGLGQVRADSC
ncbi:MAG: hypothetical protein KDI37_11915 [Xanthomonadales bacterium]|nr:hypothetical protein [Xanthomonadales bacterium]